LHIQNEAVATLTSCETYCMGHFSHTRPLVTDCLLSTWSTNFGNGVYSYNGGSHGVCVSK